MPDDHSKLVPPLPIPNRTVKRLCADDSAATSVKVGHRQALTPKHPRRLPARGCLLFISPFLPYRPRQSSLSLLFKSWGVHQSPGWHSLINGNFSYFPSMLRKPWQRASPPIKTVVQSGHRSSSRQDSVVGSPHWKHEQRASP